MLLLQLFAAHLAAFPGRDTWPLTPFPGSKALPEPLHGDPPVADLGAGLGAGDDDARGDVADPYGGVGPVPVLAAGAWQGLVELALLGDQEATQTIADAPQDAFGEYARGLLAWRQGDDRVAEVHLRESVRRDPRIPAARYALGAILLGRGSLQPATQHLHESLLMDPDNQDARQALERARREWIRRVARSAAHLPGADPAYAYQSPTLFPLDAAFHQSLDAQFQVWAQQAGGSPPDPLVLATAMTGWTEAQADDCGRAICEVWQGKLYTAQRQAEQGLQFLHTGVPGLAACQHPRLNMGWGHLNMGRALTSLGAYEPALDALGKALTFYSHPGGEQGRADTLREMGVALRLQGKPTQARAALDSALALYLDMGDASGQALTQTELAALYLLDRQYDLAMEVLEAAVGIFAEMGDPEREAQASMSLGEVLLQTGDLQQAGSVWERALNLMERADSKVGQAEALSGLGRTWFLRGDRDHALQAFDDAIILHTEVEDHAGLAATLLELGHVNTELGREEAAREALATALSIFDWLVDEQGQANVLLELGELDCARHDEAHCMQRLNRAHVVVVGLGAVGSYAVEGLARAGVGRLRLVDFDRIQRSNINRQLFALESTLDRPKHAVARERPVADPRVDHRDASASAGCLGEEVRPDLQFHEHDHIGTNPRQRTPHHPREIEREIEGPGLRVEFRGCGQAGVGGGRDHEVPVGIVGLEGLDECASEVHLADGDGVEPQAWPLALPWLDAPEALGKARAILLAGEGLEDQVWRGGERGTQVRAIEQERHPQPLAPLGPLSRSRGSSRRAAL